MNKQIKCILLDIDGTMLDPSRSLTAHTAEVLRRASERGITVSLASGRNHCFTSIMLARAGLPVDGVPVISNNGALIYDGKTTHLMLPTSAEAIEGAAEISHETDSVLMLCTPQHMFTADERRTRYLMSEKWHYDSWDKMGVVKIYDSIPEMMKDARACTDIIKALVVQEDMSVYDDVRRRLEQLDADIVESERANLEVLARGVSKGSALKAMADILGISTENIMALGDAENDMDMIAAAGFGVAMGNSPDYVKAVADYVTLDNAHDGAAAAIERFVL